MPVIPAHLQGEGRRGLEDQQEAHGQLAWSVHQREKQLETLCLSVGGGGESNPKSYPLTPTHTPSYSHVYLHTDSFRGENVGGENIDVGWVPWRTVWCRAGTHFFSSQGP